MLLKTRTRSLVLAAALGLLALPAPAQDFKDAPFFADQVKDKKLPPLAERIPKAPIVVDAAGQYGGDIVTLVPRPRDIRYISTFTYTRLVGYDRNLQLQPDLLEKLENEDDRVFTFTLRPGHRWSDGSPFTTEDFRYYWEDVAQNADLSPAGPPEFMMVDGKPPRFEILDERTLRFTWDKPNPRFLPQLAGALDPGIYRASAYLKQFHAKYADKAALDEKAKQQKLKSWAALHNRLDDMKEQTNPALPTLMPWRVVTAAPANRFIFERNPYYHRIDRQGQQLPYVDRLIMDVSASGLFAAKANAGELDLLFRGLSMSDIPVLKEGEKAKGYTTLLWPYARGTELALYPNLNTVDPVWRQLNRDIRFRRALSLGIDRKTLNNALLFGLGTEGNNTIVAESPLFSQDLRTTNADYNPGEASRLLDEIGLTKRNGAGIRLLPDGRELEIIVETDGESSLVVDGLTLIGEFWREIGVRLFVKPQDRTVLRNRSYAGLTVMVAAPGLDNAIPTVIMPPTELAPMRQDNYTWPKWGQFVETKGKNGEQVDIPEAQRLLDLYTTWMNTGNRDVQRDAWNEMLRNHAENQWSIGTISGALQPIVMRNGLQGLPAKALYSWEPTAMIGIYRPDEIFWNKAAGKEARR
ncbi:ABC transporter substrate-binding protein [Microvirga tunisiensis]|jgi:peptide/nickel transport system substrate-binding protein|uniref:ABC transporter substrate-binding protein n=1 Tax=Microvirga tunisiensis TaxID=2108360 RepID=A0A5N7MGV9_9HYPH|nr:ABC transporter substrate-binding protein [Microvirga tunisiensis]MPR07991.1 ABC transporter substrate-binding protein [Microvirga tunisiensis]MPR26302.1 ABC transporter substrate-binding protein [Microvirga tunisiensis]